MKTKKRLLNKFVNILQYIYAPAIVMIIILIVFKTKGIYPFGTTTIDYYDMGQMNAPMYYHLYDALHGTKSLFFDWYTALGINMSESVSICSLLSPFNLFFYFVSRVTILQSLSIFTMIKIMAMSASMYLFLHKTFSVNIYWKVLFSISYSFSGFVLQYYVNSQWLDIAAMFPLLLLAMHVLFQKNRIVPYIIMLTLCIITNFYASAMILMFLFFIGGLYLILLAPKTGRKSQIWSWGISTFSSIGLSAFIVLPAFNQIIESSRFSNPKVDRVQYLLNILNSVNYSTPQKWWMLFGCALAIVIIVKGVIENRKDKRTTLFVIGSILFVTLQIYFENINLIWHAGSYVSFPIRFGYMISFTLLCAGCYYVSKSNSLNKLNSNQIYTKKTIVLTILKIIMGLFIIFCIAKLGVRVYRHTLNSSHATMLFSLYIIAFIMMLVVFAVILNKRNHYINYRWIGVIVASELLLGACVFISPPANTVTALSEQSSKFIYTTNELQQELNIPSSNLDRIKNIGNTLNCNYPFILQHASISNWTHTVSGELQNNLRNMGYSTHYTRLLDAGGTAFSDALLNVKNTLSTQQLDEPMYTLVDKTNTYYLYKNNYTLPFGLTVSHEITSLNKEYDNCFQYQNAIFEYLSGQKELINSIKSNSTLDSDVITFKSKETLRENVELTYKLHISGNQALYFYSIGELGDLSFYVQDKILTIPSIAQQDNLKFPVAFNNNVLYLGDFKDQTIELKIVCPAAINEDQIQLGLLDLDKLGEFTSSYDGYTANEKSTNRGLSLTVTASAEKDMLFLPISYDAGWNCSVNGKKAIVQKVANSFIGIQLQDGVNEVNLTFIPSKMKTGSLISLITLLFLMVGLLIRKKMKINLPEKLLSIVSTAFCIMWGAAVTLVYLVPVAYTLFQKMINKL